VLAALFAAGAVAEERSETAAALLDASRALRAKLPKLEAGEGRRALTALAGRWLRVLTGPAGPVFRDWHGEYAVFDAAPGEAPAPFPGRPPRSAAGTTASDAHGGPLMHFVHYNAAAYHYLRANGLHDPAVLQSYLERGAAALPAPPQDAMVALSGWWPLDGRRSTPMPLWDEHAPARARGANGYLSWETVAVVAPPGTGGRGGTLRFAGRPVNYPRELPRAAFYRVEPGAAEREALMAQPLFRKAAIIALGRPLAPGDELALVAFHVAHLGLAEGAWLTYWWDAKHWEDRVAPAHSDAPANPWHAYRGAMTLDPEWPRAGDGGPHSCFNPWFDAVFTDTGQGNGLQANCISCHLRAGMPASGRLRVTRGRPLSAADDPATVSTRLLWSLANPARLAPAPWPSP
jgi:hypothetical protein